MAVNNVVINGETVLDLRNATATADKILKGATAYGASGELLVGTAAAGIQIAIGPAAPEDPQESMIWVKAAGGHYVFSETEPEAPTDCLVWFRVTSTGIITRADVYSAGVWTAADAYMYLSGTWVQIASSWNGELFQSGNQYSDYTGGWPAKLGTLTESDPYLKYSAGTQNIVVSSGKKIDITDFTQLHIIGRGRGDYSSGGGVSARIPVFGIAAAIGTTSVTFAAKINMTSGYIGDLSTMTEEKVLDISSFTGEYYIAATITGSHTSATLGIKKMWLV